MFKKLKIKNFQSHENSELKFSSGINIIVPEDVNDPNDVGKTSIFRALQLLCTNRPSGGNYFPKNKEKGKTEILVDLDNAEEISLIKNIKDKEVKSAIYKIGSKKFEKFGASVPDQIVSALNISEINFQNQLELISPYLITSTPGEIAKTIAKTIKIEKSDQWISSLTSEINFTNKDVIRVKQEICDIKIDLKKYENIEEIVLFVARLEKIEIKIKKYEDSYDDLININTEFIELENWINENKGIATEAEKLFYEIEIVFGEIVDLNEEKEKLEYLLFLQEDIEKLVSINKVKKDLSFLQDVIREEKKTQKEESILLEAVFLIDEIDELKKVNVNQELKSIQEIIWEIVELKKEKQDLLNLINIQKNIEILVKKYADVKKDYIVDLKSFGKCPTCLSVVNDKTIKRIAKEL